MSDTTPTNPKPSEGAMRAAEKLIDILAPGDHDRNVRMAADLIDRETGLPELIAACQAMLDHFDVNMNPSASTCPCAVRARAALSKSPNQRGA